MQYTERTDGARFNTFRKAPFRMHRKFAAFRKEINGMTRRMARMTEEHIDHNFDVEGFVDNGIQRWPAKRRPNGKKILVDTGRLKSSTRTSSVSRNSAKVVNTTPYAGKHNHPVGTRKGGMPGRQFMGHSDSLAKSIGNMIVTRLNIAAQK